MSGIGSGAGSGEYHRGIVKSMWNERMNEKGFMGFVDRWWIFWNRVGGIISIIFIIAALVTAIAAIFVSKEPYGTSRLRHQNRRYS